MTKRVKKQSSPAVDGPPTQAELDALLGRAWQAFGALAERGAGVTAEWKRYKSSPWVLKVSSGKRTLYYLQPERGAIRVTVVIGARAVEAALSGRVPAGRPIRSAAR